MNDRTTFIAIFAIGLLAAGSASFWQVVRSPAQQAASPPPPTGAPPSAVPVVMTMGDLMNTLVQPRHQKLGLAGEAQNWPLAKYGLEQLRAAFANIVAAKPKFSGMPVGQLVDVALTAPFNAVDAAIKLQDPKKFAAAYAQVTQGCNACHMELDHPYVVIKTPDASAFPNQDFAPQR
jgi:hypothetical protein